MNACARVCVCVLEGKWKRETEISDEFIGLI